MSELLNPYSLAGGGGGLTAFWTGFMNNMTFAADALHSDGKVTHGSIGTAGWGSCIAYAAPFVRADGKRLQWTPSIVSGTNGYAVGIDTRTGIFLGYDMNFSWLLQAGAALVWEGSSQKFGGTCVAGDLLEIRVSLAGAVTYWQNGTLRYTSLTTISAGVSYSPVCVVYDIGEFIDGVDLIAL